MNNKCIIVLALFAGILGGMLTRYITPPSALAQNDQSTATKEIRAQRVTLVDGMDRTVATFTVVPDATFAPDAVRRVVLRDSKGREIWSAGGSSFHQLTDR